VKALFQSEETEAVICKMVLKDQTREVGELGEFLWDRAKILSFEKGLLTEKKTFYCIRLLSRKIIR
jgi:hypothetical protein